MTLHRSWALWPDGSNNGSEPRGTRLANGGLIAHQGGTPLAVRPGVMWDGAGAVVSGTTGWTYQIRPCVLVSLRDAAQGPFVFAVSTPESVTTDPAPGSNARIDTIWVKQNVTALDGGPDTNNDVVIGVVKGTVSATPTAPAAPDGALVLAHATVTAGASNTNGITITAVHPWTAAAGAPIPVRTDSERDTLTAAQGMMVNHLGAGQLQRHNGARWQPVDRQATRILRRNTNIVLANQTTTALTAGWNPTSGDMGPSCGITMSGGVATVSEAGLYYVEIYFRTESTSTTYWTTGVYINDVDPINNNYLAYRIDQGGVQAKYSGTLPLNAGDQLKVMIRQSSGSSKNLEFANEPNRWEIRRVSSL